jgi:hypothetical protein
MQQINSWLFIMLITFFIGFSTFFVQFFIDQAKPKVLQANVFNIEKRFLTIEPNSVTLTSEDYDIYSAILTDKRNNDDFIVINEYTSSTLISDAKKLDRKIENLNYQTIDDYQSKNEENQKLINNFTIKSEVVFLSEKEHNEFFLTEPNWAKFYKRFPKAKRLISFSRVGFNQNKSQALVSVSISCGVVCGKGSFMENGLLSER